jgi:hypothetical protein
VGLSVVACRRSAAERFGFGGLYRRRAGSRRWLRVRRDPADELDRRPGCSDDRFRRRLGSIKTSLFGMMPAFWRMIRMWTMSNAEVFAFIALTMLVAGAGTWMVVG